MQSQAAADLASNTATASLLVRLDKDAANRCDHVAFVRETFIPIELPCRGRQAIQHSGVASVSCNGAAAQLTGSGFTCNASLRTGADTISVTATDAAGNSASASTSVTLVPRRLSALLRRLT